MVEPLLVASGDELEKKAAATESNRKVAHFHR